jgi:hypothetical protein
MRLTPLFLALAIASTPTFAQEASSARAEQIAQALGLERLLSDRQEQVSKATRQQMQSMLAEFENSGVPKDVVLHLASLADQFALKVTSSWDPKEAARIYANGLTELLSDKEISEAASYYKSDEGKKSYAAIQASLARMDEYVNSRTNAVMQVEFRQFLRQIKESTARK